MITLLSTSSLFIKYIQSPCCGSISACFLIMCLLYTKGTVQSYRKQINDMTISCIDN